MALGAALLALWKLFPGGSCLIPLTIRASRIYEAPWESGKGRGQRRIRSQDATPDHMVKDGSEGQWGRTVTQDERQTGFDGETGQKEGVKVRDRDKG
jgi:hypothetical protein